MREISDWVLTNPLSNKHRKPTYESHKLNPGILRELYGRYISDSNQSYAHVESSTFRAFLEYISPAANDLLPRSGPQIKTDLKASYKRKKQVIANAIRSAFTKIHLSPDVWSLENNLPILGVTAHFVSTDNVL